MPEGRTLSPDEESSARDPSHKDYGEFGDPPNHSTAYGESEPVIPEPDESTPDHDADPATSHAAETRLPFWKKIGRRRAEPVPPSPEPITPPEPPINPAQDLKDYLDDRIEIRRRLNDPALSDQDREDAQFDYNTHYQRILKYELAHKAALLGELKRRISSNEHLSPDELELAGELHAQQVISQEWQTSRHQAIMERKHGRKGGMGGWRTLSHDIRTFMSGDYKADLGDKSFFGLGEGTSQWLGKHKSKLKVAGGLMGLGLSVLTAAPMAAGAATFGGAYLARGLVEGYKKRKLERSDRGDGIWKMKLEDYRKEHPDYSEDEAKLKFDNERKAYAADASLNQKLRMGEQEIYAYVEGLAKEVKDAPSQQQRNLAIERLIEAQEIAESNGLAIHVYTVDGHTIMRASKPDETPKDLPQNAREIGTGTKFNAILERSVKTENKFKWLEAAAGIAGGGVGGYARVLKGMAGLGATTPGALPTDTLLSAEGLKRFGRSLADAREWFLNIHHDSGLVSDFHQTKEIKGVWNFLYSTAEEMIKHDAPAHALDSGSATVAKGTIDMLSWALGSMKALTLATVVGSAVERGNQAPAENEEVAGKISELNKFYTQVKESNAYVKTVKAAEAAAQAEASNPDTVEEQAKTQYQSEAQLRGTTSFPSSGDSDWWQTDAGGRPIEDSRVNVKEVQYSKGTMLVERRVPGTTGWETVSVPIEQFMKRHRHIRPGKPEDTSSTIFPKPEPTPPPAPTTEQPASSGAPPPPSEPSSPELRADEARLAAEVERLNTEFKAAYGSAHEIDTRVTHLTLEEKNHRDEIKGTYDFNNRSYEIEIDADQEDIDNLEKSLPDAVELDFSGFRVTHDRFNHNRPKIVAIAALPEYLRESLSEA